ncbi:hypothetical protein J40TS1_29710 [Paenibacillus montaniterrae]|uniref:Uncharacterized protein n=1 Tax=Paenibacillus montaniterrae TaxID=429341 RepID=A0A919YSE4_9BACL|nr:hypothetical protein J40TS1_29710 [Paenibacillus montaniterrae]
MVFRVDFQAVSRADFQELRDHLGVHREAFKRQQLLHHNLCRKCRQPRLPSTPEQSEAAYSATHTFG